MAQPRSVKKSVTCVSVQSLALKHILMKLLLKDSTPLMNFNTVTNGPKNCLLIRNLNEALCILTLNEKCSTDLGLHADIKDNSNTKGLVFLKDPPGGNIVTLASLRLWR